MKLKIVVGLVLSLVILLVPYNHIYHIKDDSGKIRLTRLDRESILLNYGTFLTGGEYSNFFLKPVSYINPWYEDMGPFDDGCFQLYAEFRGDTTIVYQGSYCKSRNLTALFQLVRVPDAFGPLNWMSIGEDKSGKYTFIDCKTGIGK